MIPNQSITALIVDDEKGARETLADMLKLYCPTVRLVGQASTVAHALPLVADQKPNVIFLDIEMPGGSGFELIERIGPTPAKIIFTTAYSQYALRAIKASALDYLLKPIEVEALVAAIEKYAQNTTRNTWGQYQLLQSQISDGRRIERIAIPSPEGYDIIKAKDICYCEGEGNYTSIYLVDGHTFVTSKTLKAYQSMLPPDKFVRIHQKYLVNIDFVKRFIRGRGGTLVMETGQHLAVSQNKKAELIQLIMG